MADRFVLPFCSVFDVNGRPFPGAKLYFFDTGTSTPKNTFSDSALTTANSNPVIADANGTFGDIFLGSGSYKVVLKNASDVQIWSADPVTNELADGSITTAKLADGSVTTAKLADNSVTSAKIVDGTIVAADIADGTITAAKLAADALAASTSNDVVDIVYNGDMEISQEFVTNANTAIASGEYIVDGFEYELAGSSVVHTAQQVSDVPTFAQSGTQLTKSLKLSVTTADASIATGDYCAIAHTVEGKRIAHFSGKRCTLQFWVKSTKTGIHSVAFSQLNSTTTESYVAEYTISASDTWEKKTITLDLDPNTAFATDKTGGMIIRWALLSGATFHASSLKTAAGDAWTVEDKKASANQVNCGDNTSNIFLLTGVSFRQGSNTGNITNRIPFAQQLIDCQRYYAKTYNFLEAVGQASTTSHLYGVAAGTGHDQCVAVWSFPVNMRAVPTISMFDPNTGTANQWTDAEAAGHNGASEVGVNITNSDTVTDGSGRHIQVVADARF